MFVMMSTLESMVKRCTTMCPLSSTVFASTRLRETNAPMQKTTVSSHETRHITMSTTSTQTDDTRPEEMFSGIAYS